MIASEPIRVPSTDGFSLAATVFRPPATHKVEQVVLICSAMGVRQVYYYDFAEFVGERNRAVITFDYRGVAGSGPKDLRGFAATLEDWGRRDVTAMIDFARREFPDVPLSVVAHSVGGQIFGLASNNAQVTNVLTIGAQSGYWRHWQGAGRLRVWTLWHVAIPLLTPLFGYFPSRVLGLGRSIPRDVALMWAHWGRHPDYLLGRLDDGAKAGYRSWSGRLRGLTATDDTIAPDRAARALLEFYPAARTEYRLVRPDEIGESAIGHFGYFRERIGQRLWPSEVDWLCDT